MYYFLIIYSLKPNHLTDEQTEELVKNKKIVEDVINYYTKNVSISKKNYNKYLFLEKQLDAFLQNKFVN